MIDWECVHEGNACMSRKREQSGDVALAFGRYPGSVLYDVFPPTEIMFISVAHFLALL